MDLFVHMVIYLALITRWLVSRFPYSGNGNPPMFGDYEAQRHWQEITVNLPPVEWYRNSSQNDLNYWGLDYPPLSAYHSYVNGKIAEWINPDWVALNKSRGHESYDHKLFMRSTVFATDIFIFFTALYVYWMSLENGESKRKKAVYFASSLFYPGLILIDHGHFQYNSFSLGLTVWSVVFLEQGRDLLGACAFCLALNYKHLSLYHALPFFCYLLGKSIQMKSPVRGLRKVLLLSFVVILTFGIIWTPWLKSLPDIIQVVKRLFPINRGLFEDKVANIWCTADNFVKLRSLFSKEALAVVSLITTLVSLLPSSFHLLFNPTMETFKYALVNSSLIFFLTSFQVHEKQILLAAMAVTLVMHKHPLAVIWFFFVSTFSLLPLLILDGHSLPYFVLQMFLAFIYFGFQGDLGLSRSQSTIEKLTTIVFVISTIGCLSISIMQKAFLPPKRYPDLYSVINASFSCLNFIGFLFYFHWQQFIQHVHPVAAEKISQVKHSKLKSQ